jgi:hypothetical protein
MPNLLSGGTLRDGDSGEFIQLSGAMPQLPATETTLTGFTLVTNELLQTSYRSSLGFVEFTTSSMYSALGDGVVRVLATGTTYNAISTTTATLVVQGGVGIGANLIVEDDIIVNGLTIGRGYEGVNNIVIKTTASNQINDFPEGQESIAIGYSVLDGLSTSYKDIAIGRYALSSGTRISNSIAIGDSALKNLGVPDYEPIATIAGVTVPAQIFISTVTQTNPAEIQTVSAHNLSTGTKIYISGVIGFNTGTSSVLNDKNFWVDVVSPSTLALYKDRAITVSLDATTATAYVTGGEIFRPIAVTASANNLTTGTEVTLYDVGGMTELNNDHFWVDVIDNTSFYIYADSIQKLPVTGIGYNAYTGGGSIGRSYIRDRNIAIGTDAAKSLIDGENNFFFGDRVAENLNTGSNNFIFGHQVAANLIRGNGIIAIGADNIVDGVDNQINIGSVFYYNGTGTATINADTEVGLGTESTSTTTGSLTVTGGAGIAKNLFVGGAFHVVNSSSYFYKDLLPVGDVNIGSPTSPFNSLYLKGSTLYLSTVTLKSPNDLAFNVESTAGFVTQTIGNLYLNSGLASTLPGNGSLRVQGGAGILGDVNIGASLTVEGGGAVTLSPSGNDVFIKPTTGGSVEIRPALQGSIDNMEIGINDSANADFEAVRVKATTSATSTTTGALQVSGGIGALGNVYAASGNPLENYLLYTPRTFISPTPPPNPRVGDFWIDDTIAAFLMRIQEGTSTFWIQIGTA